MIGMLVGREEIIKKYHSTTKDKLNSEEERRMGDTQRRRSKKWDIREEYNTKRGVSQRNRRQVVSGSINY